MVYKEIHARHIPALAELYVETYNAPPWNDGWTQTSATKKLEELIECTNAYGLVCFDEDENILGMIVGSSEIYFDCTQFYVKDFFVSLALQGKGLGSAIMREFETRLKAQGIEKIYLFTSKGDRTEGLPQLS